MKEGDREFEKLLKEAVCSYHKEKMDALPSEEELQDIQLSDDFYRKIDGLLKKQKHRWRYRFVRYGAVAACLLLFMSGTVGAAAYALLGAENFKTFFRKNARESNIEDSAVMNLEQLTDMAVTTVGTVYEDDSIRLDLKGLIKSGNRFSMIVEGTLKQEDQIVAADGPQEVHQYGFLDTEINADQDLTASSTYYFREDDKNLKANQFVYMTTYSAETGFDSEQYEFMFHDFGYYQEDEMDEEAKEETAEDSKTDTEDIVIASPLKGTVIRLEEVEDAAFSSGALGKGAAILPEEGVLYAPADGMITAMFPTGHAIGMISNSGAEILMHIGMDTVQLEGRGFKPLIQPGDKVKKGQKLLEFDMDLIKEAGYSLTTPVLITNSGQFAQVAAVDCRHTEAGETLLTIS